MAGDEVLLDLDAAFRDSQVGEVLAKLDRELIGLAPVKARIREIADLLLIDKLRAQVGLNTEPPPLHMSFTGPPGRGRRRSPRAWPRSCTGWAISARDISSPQRATTWSASTSATPHPKPKKSSNARWAACS
jgi:hypothetical protein